MQGHPRLVPVRILSVSELRPFVAIRCGTWKEVWCKASFCILLSNLNRQYQPPVDVSVLLPL